MRAGAKLSDPDKEKLKKINAELATLQTQFDQNVLKEKNACRLWSIAGKIWPVSPITKSRRRALLPKTSTRKGNLCLRLQNTTGQPVLGSLQNRALRERIMQASLSRNSKGGPFDTREIIIRTAQLRAERAKLLGYENHAAYQLEDQTAKDCSNRKQASSRSGGARRR